MKRWAPAAAFTIALAATVAVRAGSSDQIVYDWQLPSWLKPPPVRFDNPMSTAKVELGRRLFYDTRLSGNGTQSCASCHQQAKAFTDGLARSVGSTGETHPRSSMSLVNVGYATTLTWANPKMRRLEDQAFVPMYGEHPVELGLDRPNQWLGALGQEPLYAQLFAAAFAGGKITVENVVDALASFQRSIVSTRSPYDRYHFERDDSAVSDAAKRGEALFFSRPLSCFTCHGGTFFSLDMGRGGTNPPGVFFNTGLYNLGGLTSYPAANLGLFETTRQPGDVGQFKPPTLRNIAVTAPYMHDGSVATLEDALDHYAAGGRTIASGPNAGVGRENPNKFPSIRGFPMTPEQRADLIAFLKTLTDEALLKDPRFSDPWSRRR